MHTVTSGETTIDDAPVLNEGVISETENPKRTRRGRRGSRRENMAVEISENNVKKNNWSICSGVEDRRPSQSGIAIEVTNSSTLQETSSEDEPDVLAVRGRPRKIKSKNDVSDSKKPKQWIKLMKYLMRSLIESYQQELSKLARR